MLLLSILVCFTTLFQASLSTPILSSKPKPVDLFHTCTAIIKMNQKDYKQDYVPIILLHGMGGTKESWRGIIEVFALETQKKVCAVDLRNHGQSPWNDEEFDVVAMTEDIIHFMDHISAEKAVVLGHSLGGRIAVHLALNYPERIEKIIVEDMRPNGVTPQVNENMKIFDRLFKEVDKLIPQGVSEKEAKEVVRKFLKEYLAKMNLSPKYEKLDLIKCSDGICKLNTNIVIYDAAVRNITDLINESSGVYDGPALFIYGAESPFKVGEDENNIKKLFPNAELVAVEGADHIVHTAKKFETEVIKFINNKRN